MNEARKERINRGERRKLVEMGRGWISIMSEIRVSMLRSAQLFQY